MIGFFTKEDIDIYDIDGNLKATEPVHLSRQGISNNDFSHTHKFKGLLVDNTVIDEGDLLISVSSQDKYIVTSFRHVAFMNTNQINCWKCDYECAVYRLEEKFVGNQLAGTEMTEIKNHIPCVQKDVNGKMKFYDAGLLESTIKLVYIQYNKCLQLMDRLVINNNNYQIDSIDTSMRGLMALQLSEDKRL